MSQTSTKMSKGGRIVIPATIRRQLGLEEGDEVVLIVKDRELRVLSRVEALRRAQQLVKQKVNASRSLSDELIDERRREAASEVASLWRSMSVARP